jgi:glycosyltransferase involved in cell wall biosynthesis
MRSCQRRNRDILESRLGRLSNVGLSYNGVDLDEMRVPEKSQSRKRLDINPEAKVILFVGRSSGPEYRIEALTEAFSEYYGMSNWMYRFVSIIGERYPHGCLIDFFRKLRKTPQKVSGYGHQSLK